MRDDNDTASDGDLQWSLSVSWTLAQHTGIGVTVLAANAQAAGRSESRLDAEAQDVQDAADDIAAARARARLQEWREIDRCASPSTMM